MVFLGDIAQLRYMLDLLLKILFVRFEHPLTVLNLVDFGLFAIQGGFEVVDVLQVFVLFHGELGLEGGE